MAQDKPQSTFEENVASLGKALTDFEPFHSYILVATYIQPEVSKGGIIMTQKTRSEDQWQGKTGWVMKIGPMAFVDDANNSFQGQSVKIGDTIMYRISDGLPFDLNGVHCRLLQDVEIRGRLVDPTSIY